MKTLSYVALVLLWAGAPAGAAQLRYAGALTDYAGRPLEGSFLLRFIVVGDAAKERWSEQRYVKAEGGKFTTVLGSRKPLPDAALRGAYRLAVEAPPGTGWSVSTAPPPEAAASVPVYAPPAPPSTAAFPPAAPRESEPSEDVGRLERELEAARREREESKRRLEALERAVAAPGASAAVPAARLYVVLPGETLRDVAKKTLGDERHWVLIYQANSDRILRAGELAPGQKLVIPAGPR